MTTCVEMLIIAGIPTRQALAWMGYPKSSWYRHRAEPVLKPAPIPHRDRVQPAALTADERARIVAALNDEEYADLSVQQTFYRLFDKGIYIASSRTWYRIAAEKDLSGDRRAQATHPPRAIPELVATGPNTVWSWDITRIPMLQQSALHLYLIEDVFSRKPVGWRLERAERDELARDMIITAIAEEGTTPHTLHSDGGPSMMSNLVKQCLDDHDITRSKSRPHVSNDNPFSEALFKTLKYDLAFPGVFDTYDQAHAWIAAFIDRYTHQHRHSGLNGYTPASVHAGSWPAIAEHRQTQIDAAYQANPDRYRQPPVVKTPPGTVWINKPKPDTQALAA